MEKLSKIKANFNQSSLKELFKNLKKGAEIGILGTALTAGTMLGTACSNPSSGGDTEDYEQQTTETTTSNGGTTNGGTTNSGNTNGGTNNGGTTNGGNTNGGTNNGGTTTTGGGATGNGGQTSNGGNTTNIGTNKAIGNYNLHNFIGNTTFTFTQDAVVNTLDTCLKDAGTYLINSTNNFSQSATQGYFKEFIDAIQNNSYEADIYNPEGKYVDFLVNHIDAPTEKILADIIKKFNDTDKRAFCISYRILEHQSFKFGSGQYLNNTEYTNEKNEIEAEFNKNSNNPRFAGINFNNEYEAGNFSGIAGVMDTMVGQAATNIGSTEQDLRQFINLALTINSLYAMHSITSPSLQHTSCQMSLGIDDIINNYGTTIRSNIRQNMQQIPDREY